MWKMVFWWHKMNEWIRKCGSLASYKYMDNAGIINILCPKQKKLKDYQMKQSPTYPKATTTLQCWFEFNSFGFQSSPWWEKVVGCCIGTQQRLLFGLLCQILVCREPCPINLDHFNQSCHSLLPFALPYVPGRRLSTLSISCILACNKAQVLLTFQYAWIFLSLLAA